MILYHLGRNLWTPIYSHIRRLECGILEWWWWWWWQWCGITSVPPKTSEQHLPINGGFYINIEDFDDLYGPRSSLPSIHFGRSSPHGTTSGEDSSGDDGFGSLFKSTSSGLAPSPSPASPSVSRTLYIQMVRPFWATSLLIQDQFLFRSL